MMIYCKCGKLASKCTNLIKNIKHKNYTVGILFWGQPNVIDEFEQKFNERSKMWISSGFYEHLHSCCASDIAGAVISVDMVTMFDTLTLDQINNPNRYVQNVREISARLTHLAYQKVPFVFNEANRVRFAYGNSTESMVYTETSWSLTGYVDHRGYFDNGFLSQIYDIFIKNKDVKILLQIVIPDGIVFQRNGGSFIRYWDIKFQHSAYGKIDDNESRVDALVREIREELDLDILGIILPRPIIRKRECMYLKCIDELKLGNNFTRHIDQWKQGCSKCKLRQSEHAG